MSEIWRRTVKKGYEVSNRGRVRSCPRRVTTNCPHDGVCKCNKVKVFRNYKILKPGRNKKVNGYCYVFLGGKVRKYVHILVALAFIPNPKNLPEVNHKDGDSGNNHKRNLEWKSRKGNERHAYRTGLKSRNPRNGRFEGRVIQ